MGKREMETQTLSIRTRKSGDLGTRTIYDLQSVLQQAIAEKTA